jgi:hypothetical protein
METESMATAYTTADLITPELIAHRDDIALSRMKQGMEVRDGLTTYASAVLYELHRFPGAAHYVSIPEGESRETAIAQAEACARKFQMDTKQHPATVHGYLGAGPYLMNLRKLFQYADLASGKSLEEAFGATAPATPQEISTGMADNLRDPEAAIKFALGLDAGMAMDFLRDRQEGRSLAPWVEMLEEAKALETESA